VLYASHSKKRKVKVMHEYRDDELAQALSELPVPAISADFYIRLRGRITRTRPRRRIPTSRWAFAAAVIAVAALSVGGLALAGSFGFGALHRGTVYVDATTVGGPNGISTCALIGEPASQAATTLTSSGIAIQWRFTHWGTATATTLNSPTPATAQENAEAAAQAAAQAVASAEATTGGTSGTVSSVPGDSLVWDVIPDGQTSAFVFVQARNDPNAPTVSTDNCPS
jgi:hypothetical protein